MALSPELGPRDFCAQSGILWPGDPQALVQSGLGLDCRGAGKNHGSRVLRPPTGSACSASCLLLQAGGLPIEGLSCALGSA